VPVHIKIDSGMGRLGIPADGIGPLVERASAPGSGVHIDGLCTHFASADLPDLAAASLVTRGQLAIFARALAAAGLAGATPRVVHASNSAAVVRFSDAAFDWVRPGLALYGNGVAPAPELGALHPAMSLVTEIVQLREVPAGQTVGYGGLWRAARASRIAVLPVGYADGFARRLTGVADALVGGKRCPVVGAISMDIALVDVTSLGHDARVGDAVVLLGAQGQERITAAELAAHAGLTEYEVTCGVSRRVPRTYR
jgi:alanine racemase